MKEVCMLITKISPFTGKENTMEINVTEEQLDSYYQGHKTIQEAFPFLTASEREFIMTGITDEDWSKLQ